MSIFQRDLAIERGRDTELDRALDLRPDRIGIDNGAAINRADDAPDTHGPSTLRLSLIQKLTCAVGRGGAKSAFDGAG
jgi:hypothetical protein